MQVPRPGQTDLVLLSEEDKVSQVLVQVVDNLWEAVNELTRLRKTHKETYFVTIFGSARIQPLTESYELVKELAGQLSSLGCGIITGGGPGLMQAANEGAANAGGLAEHSIGIRIDLPFEQNANPFVGRAYQHKTFFSRLHHFVIASDAFIVVPGGVGTLLELSMVWQLLQVRKLYDTPLILIGKMWPDLVKWGQLHMLNDEAHLAEAVDLEIPRCAATSEQAIEMIREHKARWEAAHGVPPRGAEGG